MKVNKTINALILLTFSYAFLLTVAFSSFLQLPVIEVQSLMWQSIIEQFITWIPLIFVYYFLFRGITDNTKLDKPIINEQKLVLPAILFFFLSGFSVGIHSVSQVFEDVLRNNKNTFLYSLSYFFDEYMGHLFLIFFVPIGFIFILLELNRKTKKYLPSIIFY